MAWLNFVRQQWEHIPTAQHRPPCQLLQAVKVLLSGNVAAVGFGPGFEQRFGIALPVAGLLFIPPEDLAIDHRLEGQAGTDRFRRHRVDRTAADGVVAFQVATALAQRGQVRQQIRRGTARRRIPGTQRALGLGGAGVTAQRGHRHPGMHPLGTALRTDPTDGLVQQRRFRCFRCAAHNGVIPRSVIPRGRPLASRSTWPCQ
ncbi:hypothetical protein D3C85_636670 [compost metagenome]